MARKKSSYRTMKKLEPAVSTLSFLVPNGVSYVDLNLAMSIANRRFYSQQYSPAVAGMTLYTNNPGIFSTFVLPETWVMANAYSKGKAMWDKMNDQVLDNEGDIKGRYSDFKILMDSAQLGLSIQDTGNPTGQILTPVDENGNFTAADFSGAVSPRADWEYSQLTVPNDPSSGAVTDYYIHAVGPTTTASKGLIEGYARSRSRPQSQDPNVPTTSGWMTALFDVGEQLEELRNVIENDNDRPPYAISPEQTSNEFYPGGAQEFTGLQVHDSAIVSTTTIGGKTSIRGGLFQCGLLKFNNATGANASLQIHMVPGTHRGYLCEKM